MSDLNLRVDIECGSDADRYALPLALRFCSPSTEPGCNCSLSEAAAVRL